MVEGLLCPECHRETLYNSGKIASGRRYKKRFQCVKCLRTTIAPIDKATGRTTCIIIELAGGVIK